MAKSTVTETQLLDIGDITNGKMDMVVEITGKDDRPAYSLPITINPDAVTARLLRRYRELCAEDRDDEAIIEFLSVVMVGWKIRKPGTHEELGVSYADIESIPFLISGQIASAVIKAMYPEAGASTS